LYTSQSLYPEFLKNIDAELFTIFVKEGFSLMLTPVELMTNRNSIFESGGDYDETEEVTIKMMDFPKTVYQWNENTQQVQTKTMKSWPKSLKTTFVMNGMESVTFMFDVDQQTGNEGPPPETHYLTGAMVIMQAPERN
jgi:hypothetical protein